MRNTFLNFIIILSLLASCSPDHHITPDLCASEIDLASDHFPQNWLLVKMTGNVPNSEKTGTDMNWQEYIVLNADSTFVKSRTRDNVTTEASGTFSYSIVGTEKSVQLTLNYSASSDLIGNCYSNSNMEAYILTSKCKLMGTWAYCDGPGLEYERHIINLASCGVN